MTFKALLVFTTFYPLSFALARTLCETQVSTYQEVIRCAEEKSPAVQMALLELEEAKAQVKSTTQWKNPEFSAESVYSSGGSEGVSETEFSLGVPIELGGKRSARKSLAQGRVAEAEAALLGARAKARGKALLKLHRTRQLFHELEVIEESISTFTQLLKRYRRRPKLSPEQELSVDVFRMAKSDYELKKAAALDEVADLNTYLKVHLDADMESLKKNLPPAPKTWPVTKSELSLADSPKMKVLNAQLETAQAEMNLARSESWPTLTIGPSVKLQKEASRSTELFGLSFSLPLPLFNVNDAGRAAASVGVKLAEKQRDLTFMEQEQRLNELLNTYKRSVETLSSALSHHEIEKRHADTEKLFLRGVVPSPLVIEAHRAFVELEQSRNKREMKALETLMAIYAMTGHLPEVSP